MIHVSALIDSLGGALLRQVVSGHRDQISDVTLSGDPSFEHSGGLVLGLGIDSTAAAVDLLNRSDRTGAAAVILKAPFADDPDVARLATELGIGLVELQPQASWTHLVWLTRSVLDHSTTLAGSEIQRDPSGYGELFAFADAAAAIVSAPVTIEDADSRVLAYSELQDTADPARISTIVGRRVPDRIISHFRSRGTFRRLQKSDEPIWVDAGPDGVLPRLIIPIRAGRELLGSIWAVDPGPVPDDQVRELTRTASVIALHLLRLRAQSGAARRMMADRLRAALLTPDHETGLRLPPGPWRVVALADTGTDEPPDYRVELWESVMRRHGWTQPLLTAIDGVPIAVVTENGAPRTTGSWAWLRALAAETSSYDSSLAVLAGRPAHATKDLPRSRSEAAELIPLARTGRVAAPATTFEEAWHEIVLARARAALLTGRAPLGEGPVQALVEHDAERGTEYVTTLSTFLAHYGEPKRAAHSLHIHPNTLRYRMKHITELTGLDLTETRLRLAIAIHLTSVLDARNDTKAKKDLTAGDVTAGSSEDGAVPEGPSDQRSEDIP
jgi:hypothetical protein